MITAHQEVGVAVGFVRDRICTMPARIVEGAKLAVFASDN